MHQITLTQFIIEEQRRYPDASGDFSSLLSEIATACKRIAAAIASGPLTDILGAAESENAMGEGQKQLDLIANDTLIRSLEWTGHLSALASEELAQIYPIPQRYPKGRYLLLFDPLDGSSNIDVNLSVGTIFSILKAPAGQGEPREEDFLKPGIEQVCAGYVLYGPATTLVLTTGNGVNLFTLDRTSGEFLLSQTGLRIPESTQEFAVNLSNRRYWSEPVRRYVDECLQGEAGPRGKNFNLRWVASLVAEIHRILTRGGVFLYPSDARPGYEHGRLRLLYEANPMAFLVEQAGGVALDGDRHIRDLQPEAIHQKVPLILGSREEVDLIREYHLQAQRAEDRNAVQSCGQ